MLPDLLKAASEARTASIKLQGMEYAKELSEKLLKHAQTMEALYGEMSLAASQKVEDKKLKSLLKKGTELQEFGQQAQANSGALACIAILQHHFSPNHKCLFFSKMTICS